MPGINENGADTEKRAGIKLLKKIFQLRKERCRKLRLSICSHLRSLSDYRFTIIKKHQRTADPTLHRMVPDCQRYLLRERIPCKVGAKPIRRLKRRDVFFRRERRSDAHEQKENNSGEKLGTIPFHSHTDRVIPAARRE